MSQIEDDECDSNFFYRLRRPVIAPLDIEPESVKQEPDVKKEAIDTGLVLNKSLNSSDFDESHDEQISSIDTSLDIKTVNDGPDLCDLTWLRNYDLPRHVPLTRLDSDSESESEHDYSYLNLFQKTPFFNKLFTHSKPPYSYSFLTYMAIESKLTKCASLKEIYSWFTLNFPYFRTIPSASWKNEIKHNLMYNQYFRRVDTSNDQMPNSSQQRNKHYAKISLWTVKSDYRDSLSAVIKDTPHKAFCLLLDLPDNVKPAKR
jgi:hypothetical protein